jgi:hypothetical protein
MEECKELSIFFWSSGVWGTFNALVQERMIDCYWRRRCKATYDEGRSMVYASRELLDDSLNQRRMSRDSVGERVRVVGNGVKEWHSLLGMK